MSQQKLSTKEQVNNLIEFRQAIYENGLTDYRDAQFELIDALLVNQRVNSFAELSLSPLHRRGWASAYMAVEAGNQSEEWLSSRLREQLPTNGVVVLPIDTTVWPHPSARTLDGLVYEHSPTAAKGKHTAVKGHVYSLLSWIPERGGSWALPLASTRLLPAEKAVEIGVTQVKTACRQQEDGALLVIVGDGKYGNHRFFGSLRDESCVVVARLRRDRVLYGSSPPYAGRGRPRKHGRRFAFKEPETWPEPDAEMHFSDERWGQVHLRAWDRLHAKQDADTVFIVLRAEVHCQRDKRPDPIWLGFIGAADYTIQDVWLWFDHRWSIEPSIRFRKRRLYWTLPAFQASERCDRWTWLTDLAYWQLFLARELVRDRPLPWQKAQTKLTPGRVLQSMGLLFAQLGSPTRTVKLRGKSPGWRKGRKRSPPLHFKVVKRGKKQAKFA
jgi:hypothetical protein